MTSNVNSSEYEINFLEKTTIWYFKVFHIYTFSCGLKINVALLILIHLICPELLMSGIHISF